MIGFNFGGKGTKGVLTKEFDMIIATVDGAAVTALVFLLGLCLTLPFFFDKKGAIGPALFAVLGAILVVGSLCKIAGLF